MTLKKMDSAYSGSDDLIYFQNLIPGTQDSPFIDRYKSNVLDNEPEGGINDVRRQLLLEFPPVLSFTESQKKGFYEHEAENCENFCCGAMQVTTFLDGKQFMQQKDSYMASTGSGKLYEGSADSIKNQMQNDIRQQSFSSNEQNQMMNGLQQFDSTVSQRGSGAVTNNSNELAPEQTRLNNPFLTKPTNN